MHTECQVRKEFRKDDTDYFFDLDCFCRSEFKCLQSFLGSEGQDELVCSPPTKTNDSEHVIVFANGYVSNLQFKMYFSR